VEISSGEKMKPILLVAILLLAIFIIPMTFVLQQSVQTPKNMLSKRGFVSTYVLCGAIIAQLEPGSGGGGQGVI
jgi:hypothetical protein